MISISYRCACIGHQHKFNYTCNALAGYVFWQRKCCDTECWQPCKRQNFFLSKHRLVKWISVTEYEIEMADSTGFRVGVDAREMRQDIRSRFFIYVDLLRDRYISDIENRIRCFLCVDGPISLVIGKNYLPSAENVRLLCAGDVLK